MSLLQPAKEESALPGALINSPNPTQDSTLRPDPVAIKAFLEILKPQRIYAIHEQVKGMTPCEVNPHNLEAIVGWAVQSNLARSNLYFQLNPARPGVLKKPSKGEVACGLYLHVDDDDRIYESDGLPSGVPEPTCLIDSGNGLQPIWKLAEPVQFSSLADAEEFERYNLELRRHLRGKDGCHNVDRILRVAGSINWPSAAKQKRGCVPVMAKLLEHDPSRRYSIAQFAKAQAAPVTSEIEIEGVEAWQEPAPGELGAGDIEALRRELDAIGPRGQGKSTTFKAIKSVFHDFGCSIEEGAEILYGWNDRCGSPHDQSQLERQLERCAERIQSEPDKYGARGTHRGLDCVRGMLANSPVYSASAAPANLNSASAAPAKPYSTVDDAIEDLFRASKLPRIATGFPAFDQLLGGGLVVSEMTGLVGGTGGGKTALAVQIAAKVAESGPVIFASYELLPRQLVARVASQRLPGVSWLDVLSGRVPAESIRGAVPKGLLFAPSPSLDTLKGLTASMVQQTGKQPLVVIDYLQCFARHSTKQDARLATSEVSGQFRQLAQELSVAMLVVSSTARGKDETISNARKLHPAALLGVGKESGDIEYDVGGLLVLGHTGDSDDSGRNISTLTIAKNRYGRQAHLDFRFDGASGLWTEIGIHDESTAKPSGDELAKARAIVKAVREQPGALSKNNLKGEISGKGETIGKVVDKLLEQGALSKSGVKLFVTGDCPAEYLEGGAQ